MGTKSTLGDKSSSRKQNQYLSKKLKGNALLMLAALIWGSGFVAQKEGMNLLSPVAFTGIRSFMGALTLLPVIFLMGRSRKAKADDLNGSTADSRRTAGDSDNSANAFRSSAGDCAGVFGGISPDGVPNKATGSQRKTLLLGGLCCGIVLFFAGNVQQIGLFYTSVGHSGFITALYVVIVPIFGLFLKKKVRPAMWGCIAVAAIGLYLLSIPAGGFGEINKGDIITLLCSVLYATHILVIDYFSPKVDGVKMSCIQFLVCGILSVIFMGPVDTALGFTLPTLTNILDSWLPILYSGVLSCGVAYTLQIVAQKDADPTIATMILCLESVFALLSGMVVLGEIISLREGVGCILMFAAIVVSNLPICTPKDTLH